MCYKESWPPAKQIFTSWGAVDIMKGSNRGDAGYRVISVTQIKETEMKTPNSLLLSMMAAIGLSFSASALAGEPNTALFEKNKNKHTESRHHGEKNHPSQAMPHRDCAPGTNQDRECVHETTHEKDDHHMVIIH